MIQDKINLNREDLEQIINSPIMILAIVAVFRMVVDKLKFDANMLGNYYSIYTDKTMEVPDNKIKYDSIDIDRFEKMTFGDTIIRFIEEFEKKFPNIDYTNFYNNINEMKVKRFIHHTIGGYYDPIHNRLVYNTSNSSANFDAVMYHELFHVASTFYKDKKMYSGFSQVDVDTRNSFGTGINEGYTQVLVHKMYMPYTYADGYYFEHSVAQDVEKIIGEEKMEELYFKCDLPGLIKELSRYANKSDVIKFINEVDFMNMYKFKKLTKQNSYMIRDSIDDIRDFLEKTMERKENSTGKTLIKTR